MNHYIEQLVVLLAKNLNEIEQEILQTQKQHTRIARTRTPAGSAAADAGEKEALAQQLQQLNIAKDFLTWQKQQKDNQDLVNTDTEQAHLYKLMAQWFKSDQCTVEEKQPLAMQCWQAYFTIQLAKEQNPLGLSILSRDFFDEPAKFTAFLLWLLNRTVTPAALIQSGLLQDFFASCCNIPLDHKSHPVHQVYRLLAALADTHNAIAELITQAEQEPCGTEAYGSLNLCGKNLRQHTSQHPPRRDAQLPSLSFTDDPDHQQAILQLFGYNTLILALDFTQSEHKCVFRNLLTHNLGGMITKLPPLILNPATPISKARKMLEMIVELSESEAKILEQMNANSFYLYAIPFGFNKTENIRDHLSAERASFESNPIYAQVPLLAELCHSPALNAQYADEIDSIKAALFSQLIRWKSDGVGIPDDIFDLVQALDLQELYKAHMQTYQNEINAAIDQAAASHQKTRGNTAANDDETSFDYYDLEMQWGRLLPTVNLIKQFWENVKQDTDYPFGKYDLKSRFIEAIWKKDTEHTKPFDLTPILDSMLTRPSPEAGMPTRYRIHFLMPAESALFPPSKPEPGQLYVRVEENVLQYITSDMTAFAEISPIELGEVAIPSDFTALNAIENKILFKTSERGHTPPWTTEIEGKEAENDRENKRTLLEILVRTHHPVLPTIIIDYLSNTYYSDYSEQNSGQWLEEKFGDDKSVLKVLKKVGKGIATVNDMLAHEILSLLLASSPPLKALSPSILETIMYAAARIGHQAMVEYLTRLTGDQQLEYRSISEALDRAAEAGQLAVVQHLTGLTGEQQLGPEALAGALRQAAEEGQLAVVQHLTGLTGDQQLGPEALAGALRQAAEEGQLAVVQHLTGLTGDQQLGPEALESALRQAAESGQLAVVQHLAGLTGEQKLGSKALAGALRWAAGKGEFAVVQHLTGLTGEQQLGPEALAGALGWAAEDGQLAVVQHLTGLTGEQQLGPQALEDSCALDEAAAAGQLAVVQHLTGLTGEQQLGPEALAGALGWAAGDGQFAVVQHLTSLTGEQQLGPEALEDSCALDEAAEAGQLAVVQHLTSLTGEQQLGPEALAGALGRAAWARQWAVVQHLTGLTGDQQLGSQALAGALGRAAGSGQFAVVQHLTGLTGEQQLGPEALAGALGRAARAGQWAVVEYLAALEGNNQPDKKAISEAFKRAAKVGKESTIICLTNLAEDNQPDQKTVSEVFIETAQRMDSLLLNGVPVWWGKMLLLLYQDIFRHLLSLTGDNKLTPDDFCKLLSDDMSLECIYNILWHDFLQINDALEAGATAPKKNDFVALSEEATSVKEELRHILDHIAAYPTSLSAYAWQLTLHYYNSRDLADELQAQRFTDIYNRSLQSSHREATSSALFKKPKEMITMEAIKGDDSDRTSRIRSALASEGFEFL